MSAWIEGHLAQQRGEAADANPHTQRTGDWWAWRAGWYFLGNGNHASA